MILKMRAQQYSSQGPCSGWRYVDDVTEAYNYGNLTKPDSADEVEVFENAKQLLAAVERMWGPLDIHRFHRVYFPEFDPDYNGGYAASIVRLDHSDDRVSLAVLMGEAFLLGNDGKTIDRLL